MAGPFGRSRGSSSIIKGKKIFASSGGFRSMELRYDSNYCPERAEGRDRRSLYCRCMIIS